MMQLQSNNPRVDDFYYQAYTLKQERAQHGDDPQQLKMYVARHAPQKENVYVPGMPMTLRGLTLCRLSYSP